MAPSDIPFNLTPQCSVIHCTRDLCNNVVLDYLKPQDTPIATTRKDSRLQQDSKNGSFIKVGPLLLSCLLQILHII